MKAFLKNAFHPAGFIIAFCLLLPFQPGCKTPHLAPDGVYHGDTFLFEAESDIVTSVQICKTFLEWERANRSLVKGTPAITKAADNMRLHLPEWKASADRLRDAYVAAPSDANRTALSSALAVLRQAFTEATAYLVSYGPGHTFPTK